MCGIFAVLREPSQRAVPDAVQLEGLMRDAKNAALGDDLVASFRRSAESLSEVNALLKGAPGVQAIVNAPGLADRIDADLAAIQAKVASVEFDLDAGNVPGSVALESLNESLVQMRDLLWAVGRDRLATANGVIALLAGESSTAAVDAYTSVQMALSAIDRLEVRGRDSAGISVLVHSHGLSESTLRELTSARHNPLFTDNAVEVSGETAVFAYKAAAEIGALGDNVRGLRASIESDKLLRQLLTRTGAQAAIVAHTRWASVGTVSEPNTHPVDSQESDGVERPYVIASLNGDVDNFVELKRSESIHCADEITTDAKVIPTMVSRRLEDGAGAVDAFRSAIEKFHGSVAIASAVASEPDRLLLGVRGSGQGCYIGFAEGAFLVASEPYGLVEQCDTYLRLDGEAVSSESGKNGQLVELVAKGAGTLNALRRLSVGGEELPVAQSELVSPEITTRDIDRGDAPHFLLKEITESPQSVRRTLRGKIVGGAGRLQVALSKASFPDEIRKALAARELTQIIAIGQGTASVASRSLASILGTVAPGVSVSTCPATELSGFAMRDDMSDTLIVAVSQSGTTTDTNRTVDMVRARGAKVIAIVNRRESDLTEKADGVLYTSDGRDVEMSVASTKAFYAQVVAASLLGIAIADALDLAERHEVHTILEGLKKLPDAMVEVLKRRPELAAAAQTYAPQRRSWAIVGNGPNHIAAQELRIKMSELCYKSIAFDVTEDKKHIDLSAEPMIFVCAAGLSGATASDVAKEIAIYKAHKALPIVICSEGTDYDAPVVVKVPVVHPAIDFVLSTMAGHIFGYEAALAIDSQGRLMRAARAVLDDVLAGDITDEEQVFAELRRAMAGPSRELLAHLRSGALDGHLQTSTAVRLAVLLRVATGLVLLDSYEVEVSRSITPLSMMAELMRALTDAVDELSRPIDAVKHQAKTVTVGISRPEESYSDNALVDAVIGTGTKRERLSYRSMRLLAALAPAVTDVIGYTRYEIDGDVAARTATVRVVDKGGVAKDIASRADSDPRLTGTKHRAAYERIVTVGRGERDGRSVIIVPETVDQRVTGIVLLHVTFAPRLGAQEARKVLTGYRGRYSALVDAVTETEPDFDDMRLEQIPILSLLVDPVRVLAKEWRS